MSQRILVVLLLVFGLWVRAKVGQGWTFSGADSYAYVGAASEVREHHSYGFRQPLWYPNQPARTPSGYGRLPGYPLFIAALLDGPLREYQVPFRRIKGAQAALDLVTAALIFLAARWLTRGRPAPVRHGASFAALVLCLLDPRLVLATGSILSETLATFMTSLIAVLVLCALLEEERPRRATLCLIGAGCATALGTLVRVDVGVSALLLPLPWILRARFIRWRQVALAFVALALCYSPWIIRNLVTFGEPHAIGRPCDIRGREMPHTSFFGWFATWVVRESETPDTLYCFMRPECVSRLSAYPDTAFDSPEERAEVARLFRLREAEGLSQQVDEGFRRLTLARLRRDPVRTLLRLPLQRVYHLWIGVPDQPLRSAGVPWPTVAARVRPHLRDLTVFTVVFGVLGFLALLRRRWQAAVVLATAILGRTAFLALIGFVEMRYILEVLPLALLLCGLAVGQGVDLGRLALRGVFRRRASPPPPPAG